ncbi:hypothetical protein OEZ86_001672 [Tetradesmus obliquus]|nr:hypothetical protein OEZ86_001672 [Tetradesmus obliquus]
MMTSSSSSSSSGGLLIPTCQGASNTDREADVTRAVHRLLARGFPVNVVQATQGGTALCNAVLLRFTEVVRALLAAGADVDLPWAGGPLAGSPPLYSAASGGHVELMRLLIGAGADVHVSAPASSDSLVGASIMQAAAAGGHLEAMLLLVEAGAAWRPPRGTAGCKDAAALYALKVPGCKVSYIEGLPAALQERWKGRLPPVLMYSRR